MCGKAQSIAFTFAIPFLHPLATPPSLVKAVLSPLNHSSDAPLCVVIIVIVVRTWQSIDTSFWLKGFDQRPIQCFGMPSRDSFVSQTITLIMPHSNTSVFSAGPRLTRYYRWEARLQPLRLSWLWKSDRLENGTHSHHKADGKGGYPKAK